MPNIAIVWDFDGTLTPQDSTTKVVEIFQAGQSGNDFWKTVKRLRGDDRRPEWRHVLASDAPIWMYALSRIAFAHRMRHGQALQARGDRGRLGLHGSPACYKAGVGPGHGLMATDIRDLLELLRSRADSSREAGHARFVTAIGGSVAVGKSTLAQTLRDAIAQWPGHPRAQVVPTDGFLFPNSELAERNLSMRKGFPESYDVEALRAALAEIKTGRPVAVPLYSHVTYDVDHGARAFVDEAEIVILDGLHLGRVRDGGTGRLIDQLVYLDADEADIETWFRDRLIPLMQAGRTDRNSFYYAFRALDDAGQRAFAERVWREINLPNLRDHIVRDRDSADIVVRKGADHGIVAIETR